MNKNNIVDEPKIIVLPILKKVDETAESLDELQERKINLTNSLNKVDDRVGEIATLSEQYSVEETELNEKIKIYRKRVNKSLEYIKRKKY